MLYPIKCTKTVLKMHKYPGNFLGQQGRPGRLGYHSNLRWAEPVRPEGPVRLADPTGPADSDAMANLAGLTHPASPFCCYGNCAGLALLALPAIEVPWTKMNTLVSVKQLES